MSSRTRQAMMLVISVICLSVAGVFFYQNADEVSRRLGLHNRESRAPETKQAEPVARNPKPAKPEPTITRPKRPAYPDHPTVAVLDFGVDRDTYLGEKTASGLSELVRQLLVDDQTFRYVDRTEIDRVRQEHELGLMLTTNPTDRLELGRWLKAHLIVTGRFRDIGGPEQGLELAVIDTTTAHRVTSRRVAFKGSLDSLEAVSSGQVEGLAEAVGQMLADAHEILVNARGARVVSFLFFRNVSQTERLTYLESDLPDLITEFAASDPSVRFVRIQDPAMTMDEQELSLIGLATDNADAWQTAADYYLWGLIEERKDSIDGGDVVTDPNDIPVEITLVLWHGLGEPIEIKETAPMRDIDKAVETASRRAWDLTRDELPDQVSLSSRDALVKLLTKSIDRPDGRVNAASDNWTVRRHMMYRDRMQLAWFLNPDNGYFGLRAGSLDPTTGFDQRWLYLRRQLSQTDRLIRRYGLFEYTSSTGKPREGKQAAINEDLVVDKILQLSSMSDAARYAYDFMLPPDMPKDAYPQIHHYVVDELIELGKRVSDAINSDMLTEEKREKYRGGGLFRMAQYSFELINDLNLAGDLDRARAFEAWWPVIESRWREKVAQSKAESHPFYTQEVQKITRLFAASDTLDRYQRLMGDNDGEADAQESQPLRRITLNPQQVDELKRHVAELREQKLLPRPVSRTGTEPSPRIGIMGSGSTHRRSQPAAAYQHVPHLAVQYEKKVRLNELRYLTPEDGSPPEPRHSEAPLIEPAAVPLAWHAGEHVNFDPNYNRRPGLDHQVGVEVRDLICVDDRFLGLAEFGYGGFQGKPTRSPIDALYFNTLDFSLEPALSALPALLGVHDAVYLDGRLWVATEQQGLVRYNTQLDEYESFAGEHGLPSRHIQSLYALDDYLIARTDKGMLTLVSRLNETNPTIEDLKLPVHGDLRTPVGNTVVIEANKPAWFDLDTKQSVDVYGWIREHVHGVNPEEEFVWVRGIGDAFYVMLMDRMILIDADLNAYDIYPSPIPPLPLDELVIQGDDGLVWFAYGWPTSHPVVVKKPNGRDETIPPPMRSEIVLWRPGDKKATARWQVDGEVRAITIGAGELYIVCQHGPYELLAYNRRSVLELAGLDENYGPTALTNTEPAYGISEIGCAAFTGDVQKLKQAIAQNTGAVNAVGETGWSPLMYAVRGGHAEAVRELLEAGADPNHTTAGIPAITPMLLATTMERSDLIELLHRHGARLDLATSLYGMPAHTAVRYQAYRSLRWLIDHGAPFDKSWVLQNRSFGWPDALWLRPLSMAIRQGDDKSFGMLLDAGADPSGGNAQRYERTPLMYAVHRDRPGMLTRLLSEGADVNELYDGATAHGMAVSLGKDELAQLLLDDSAETTAEQPEMILIAIEKGDKALVEKLLNAGVHVDTPFFDDRTLSLPIRFGYAYNKCATPALWAIMHNQIEIYDWLVNEKNVNPQQPVGEYIQGDMLASALVDNNEYERAIDLVAMGYSIDIPPLSNGRTALMHAADNDKPERVELLLRMGADPGRRNTQGKRAIDLTEDERVRGLLQDAE